MGFLDFLGFKRAGSTTQADVDPNFSANMQFYVPGQPVYTPKNFATFVSEGYRKNPTVYGCVNKISSTAAGISWKLYTDKTKKREIEQHPILDLWNNPNPGLRGSGPLLEAIFGFWHISGNSYLWAYRPNPKAPPLALWPLRPDRMKAVVGAGKVENYVYGYGSNNPQIYEISDTMHLKFAAYDDDVYGLSPLEVASYYAQQNNEAMAWNTALMQNSGRPASVFSSKGYLTTEQRNQIKDELMRKYSGKLNAGMPLVLEADMQWQNMSLKPAELDWLASRLANMRDIAAIFDIAPELLGDGAAKTFSNMMEARQALYLENVLPKLDRLRDYINSWLLPMYPDLDGAYFTYDTKDIEALQPLFQAAQDSEEARARDNWQAGGITLNEYREMIGKEPIPGGDAFSLPNTASFVSLEDLAKYSKKATAPPPAPIIHAPPSVPNDPPPDKPAADDEAKKTIEAALALLTKLFAQHLENKSHDIFTQPPHPHLQTEEKGQTPATPTDPARELETILPPRQDNFHSLAIAHTDDRTEQKSLKYDAGGGRDAYRNFIMRYE